MVTKFRLMATEINSATPLCQHQTLSNDDNFQSQGSAKLAPMVRRKVSVRDILARKMREAGGITPPEISRRAAEKGYVVSPTAIKEMLREGGTENPGLFTLEAIAVGLNLSPVQFVAELLGDRTEDSNFKAGKFAVNADLYKGMTPTQKQKADPLIDGLTWQLQHIKTQK